MTGPAVSQYFYPVSNQLILAALPEVCKTAVSVSLLSVTPAALSKPGA